MRVKTFYRMLRIIAAVTLFFFSWSFLPLWQAVAFAAESRKASGVRSEGGTRTADPSLSPLATPPSSPLTKGGHGGSRDTTGDRFEKALESIRENISKAGEKLALSGVEGAVKGEDDAREQEAIKSKRAEVESADAEFKKEFTATEKKLKDAKLPKEILDRHYKFVKHYEDNLKELRANLDDIEQAKTMSDRRAKIEKARLHLEKVKTPSKHQKLDPNNLPFKARKASKAHEPRLKKEDFEKDFPPQRHKGSKTADSRLTTDFIANEREWERIVSSILSHLTPNSSRLQLAYNDIASDVPFILPLPSGESIGSVPEWFNRGMRGGFATIPFAVNDFTTNSELSTLNLALVSSPDAPNADDLAETPEVQFTQDIRDLSAQLGNNSLRIYEAIRNNFRYEPYYGSLKGAQQTLREKAGNDFDLASLLISSYRAAGIPARYAIATISMPLSQAQSWLGLEDPRMVGRLFVSAGVPIAVDYTAGIIRLEHVFVQAWVPYQNGRGALNGPGDTWIYMDPSFKETKVTQILDQTIPAFDQIQYLSQLRSEGPSEYYSALIQENLNSAAPGRTVYAVAQHREIVPLNFGMLLGMPQYDIVTMGGSFQEVPDWLRYKIVFELTDPETLETSLSYQATTVELADRRITLSYSPATTNDQSIISNYGDIYSTPAYLIKIVPELKLEGASIAHGSPIGSGSTHTFTMRFVAASGDSEQVVNNVVAGAYYAIAFDLQTVTQGMVFERTQKLQAMNDAITAGGTATLDDHAGEMLYATALTYFQKLDAANRTAQELLKFADLRGVSEAIFSIDINATYLFGVPASIDVSGVHIDVDRDMHLPIPVDGNTAKIKEYNLLIGSNSSYFEHRIIEDIYPTGAISAVKGLQLANKQGIHIYTINKDNINAIMPLLQVRSETQADIVNAANAGKEVIVPQQEIIVNDWIGLGYIALNPQSGEGAYIISGGYSGGDSTGISLFTWIKTTALTENVTEVKVANEAMVITAIESSVARNSGRFPGEDNVYGTPDDVLIPFAKYDLVLNVTGPQNTKCAGQTNNMFYNPDWQAGSALFELDGTPTDVEITKYLTLGDMIVNSGSTSYARISGGLADWLDKYITLLLDNSIEPQINSVYRTWYHNCELPNAVPKSNHQAGIAADVGVSERQAAAAQIALSMFGSIGGVGHKKYKSFVHVDLGKEGREW